MRAAVGASSFGAASPNAMDFLREHGIEVVKNPYGRRLTEEETIRHLQGADGLLAGLEPLNDRVFSRCPNLRAIARIGIGMENVDMEAAKRHGIKVSNTPDGPTDAVAEMTLAALLALNHRLVPSDRDVHAGVWKKRMGQSIRGQRVLVVGYGRIGRKVGELLSGLGANVMVYDKYLPEESTCTLEEGLEAADAVTIHASGSCEILGERELARMKPTAVLLNSARGPVVNEEALCRKLEEGSLAGFWGDALWQEPYEGRLRECPNAILTPHISTYTASCREKMEMDAARNLARDLGL